MLAKSSSGKYIVYPRIRYLVKFSKYNECKGKNPVFPGVVPFPNLLMLELRNGHLFRNDVLFRSSQHTLRSIKLELSSNMAKQLLNIHTFTGSIPYECLDNVEISTLRNDASPNGGDYLQFIRDIRRHAKILRFKISRRGHKPTVGNIITQFNSISTLQVLHIGPTGLSPANIVEFV